MRGIGKGQTVELVVVPEVKQLISATVGGNDVAADSWELRLNDERVDSRADEDLELSDTAQHESMLQSCVTWLLHNSM
eukprot:COSAG06_NODE_33087_length_495_cov_1.545455_1_plen_77_part_10